MMLFGWYDGCLAFQSSRPCLKQIGCQWCIAGLCFTLCHHYDDVKEEDVDDDDCDWDDGDEDDNDDGDDHCDNNDVDDKFDDDDDAK